MPYHTKFATLLLAILLPVSNAYTADDKKATDVQNDEMDVTLFRGAANNSYFPVYFEALPEKRR